MALSDLDAETVRRWHTETLVGRPTYRAHAYQLLRAICMTAVEDGWLAANPCTIKRAGSTAPKRAPVILDVSDVAKLADVIDDRYRALLLISAWCGTRFGETSELRRKDINDDLTVITVARGVTHRNGAYHVNPPKSRRVRQVPVPPHIRADIKHHLDAHTGPGPEALLFTAPWSDGEDHLNATTFRRHFNTALAAIGREGVRVHDLRHFSGTQAARVGGNLAEVMGFLGHSTVAASLRYQQIASGRPEQIAAGLSRLAEAARFGQGVQAANA